MEARVTKETNYTIEAVVEVYDSDGKFMCHRQLKTLNLLTKSSDEAYNIAMGMYQAKVNYEREQGNVPPGENHIIHISGIQSDEFREWLKNQSPNLDGFY